MAQMHALIVSPDYYDMYVFMYRIEHAVLELCFRYEQLINNLLLC